MNYIVWESVEAFSYGFELPEFQQSNIHPAWSSRPISFRGLAYPACALERG
jgi:hypothetical protein